MPSAVKATREQLPLAPNGSILSTAVAVTALREERVKVCIYGRNRAGKTTLAAQFAKPLLLISTEPDANGGAMSVSDMEGVYLQRVSAKLLGQDSTGRWLDATDKRCARRDTVKGSAKIVAIANELLDIQARGDKCPFETVVLDTVTSTQDLVLVELLGLSAVPEMLGWGMVPDGVYQQRAEKLRETVRRLLELTICNVVILAQEKDHNSQEDRSGRSKILHTMQQGSFMAPALGATNAEWLETNCGYVIQIYEDELKENMVIPQTDAQGKPLPPSVQSVGTGKRARHLRLLYHPNFAAGGRWTFNRDTPEFVTAPTPLGLYAAMARYIPSLKVKVQ